MADQYIDFRALLDSGSSHCFIDSEFVKNHKLATRQITPIPLHLFDGSSGSHMTQAIDLEILLESFRPFMVTLYVTSLNSADYSAVLGYNWLRRQNPVVDWQSG